MRSSLLLSQKDTTLQVKFSRLYGTLADNRGNFIWLASLLQLYNIPIYVCNYLTYYQPTIRYLVCFLYIKDVAYIINIQCFSLSTILSVLIVLDISLKISAVNIINFKVFIYLCPGNELYHKYKFISYKSHINCP